MWGPLAQEVEIWVPEVVVLLASIEARGQEVQQIPL